MPRIATRFGDVDYERTGEGPPVVMLHATLHDRDDFDLLVPLLARDHSIVRIDWPGHGHSPPPHEPHVCGAALFADLLEEVTARLDLPPAVLIGNSVGGFAAARLALSRPDDVAGLVLVNTGGFTRYNALTRAFCRMMGRPGVARRALPPMVHLYMRAQTEHDRALATRVAERARSPEGAATAASLWRSFIEPEHDLLERATRLRVPTMLVWGRKDLVASIRDGRRAAELIPGARLVELDAGHVPFSSQPDEFHRHVRPFLAEAFREADGQVPAA